jgi:hypothetical protein
MRSHFDAEGEIRGTDLLGALVALWREGASGTLQFSRSGATAGFDIAAGDVVRTASSDPRFDTAAILVRAGKLDQATLERCRSARAAIARPSRSRPECSRGASGAGARRSAPSRSCRTC